MKKMTYILFLLAIQINTCPGQEIIKGKVLSIKTGQALTYVNIAKASIREGTYSDDKGEFEITLQSNDSLFFSAIGFKKKYVTLFDIKRQMNIIYLDEEVYELETVTVKSTRIRERGRIENFGFHKSKKDVRHSTKNPGYQIVVHIENKEKEYGLIDAILLNIVSSGKSRIRIRVYSCDDKLSPDKDMLKENAIVDVGTHTGILSVDLQKYEITFPPEGLIMGVEFMGNVDRGGNLVSKKGDEITCKIFMSRNEIMNSTWFSFRGKTFEHDMGTAMNGTISNAVIGAKIRFYDD